jgi:hypothetical protein
MTQTLIIDRFAYTPNGTFGRMTMPDGEILYTVEDPWRDNRRGESCIPEGVYTCVPRPFHRGGYPAIHVTGVPGRSLILFHVANSQNDVRGCIGPGESLGWVHGQWAVTNSRRAFGTLMRHYGGKDFTLTVRQYVPDRITALQHQPPCAG